MSSRQRKPPPDPEQTALWSLDEVTISARRPGALPLPLPDKGDLFLESHGNPVRVGTSGFSFRDWSGPFYPVALPQSERLAFYARYFPALEVNSTYYRIPHPRVFRHLVDKTPEHFEFVVKAHQSMTHQPDTPAAHFDEFHRSIEPLVETGRMQGVLAQFPWRFRRGAASERQLDTLRERLAPHPLFVEFRHESWIDDQVFQSLTERDIGYCSVDEPPLPGLVPPVARRTTDTAYVRLHGRNAQNWWGGRGDRYDYDYRREELEEWKRKVLELAERAKKTFVFFNNCHAGQAARNARLMQEMLARDLRAARAAAPRSPLR